MSDPVWPFIKQRPKAGYVNNPNWTSEAASEDDHNPCGYWLFNDIMLTHILYGAGSDMGGQLAQGDWDFYSEFLKISDITDWIMLAAGGFHTLALRANGDLWGCGTSTSGEIAAENKTVYYEELTKSTGSGFSAIAAGRYHSLALKFDGSLWATGSNLQNQLGIPAIGTNVNAFTQVGTDTDWIMITTGSGSWFSAALKSDGTIWSWGENDNGQLGQGDTTTRDVPTQIGSDSDWIELSAGEAHLLARKVDGTIYGVGFNSFGQLGLGDNTGISNITQIGSDSDWARVYGGEYFSYAQKTNGTIYSTGDNDDGQLGQGNNDPLNIFTQVGSSSWDYLSLGQSGAHMLALDNSRNLSTVGRNNRGQLGIGTFDNTNILASVNFNNIIATAAGQFHSLLIKEVSIGTSVDPVWPFVRQTNKDNETPSKGFWSKTT